MLKKLTLVFIIFFIVACTNNSIHSEKNKIDDIIIDYNIENFDFSKKYNEQLLKKKVKLLINRMLEASTARKAYSDLENLGKKATPYIIMEMNDYRKVAEKTISLKNKNKDSFEGIRHIGVEVVADVLSEILKQVEGKIFSYIPNEQETNEERRKEIYQWKLWLYKKIHSETEESVKELSLVPIPSSVGTDTRETITKQRYCFSNISSLRRFPS